MAFFSFFSRKPNQSTPHRRRARLGVESLETRATPTANTISGFVYHDANNNGLFDSGESPLSNVAVQLKNNATNQIVGNTITDSNGFYQFANDGNVVTTPTSITKTVTFPETDTNFDLSGAVDRFDPALGVLNSIDIIHDGAITSSIQVENTSRASGSTINGTVSGNLNLVAPGVNDVLTLSQNAGSITVATYDNTLDFGGTSGGNLGTRTATGTRTTTLTGASLAAWQGTGQVTVQELGTATSSAGGGGNITAAITSSGRSTITVRYNYTPSNGLQPGTYTITETQPSGYTDGKDALGGVPINNSIGTDIIVLTLANTSLPNNNFGELQNASLSGFVYVDANDNGIKEAEQPIAGVIITLTGFNADGPVSPLFAFGHGLSYAEVSYGKVTGSASNTMAPVTISVPVSNVGDRAAIETVQCYVRDVVASVARPDWQLVGFARVELAPGATRTVTFTVHPSMLAFFDASMSLVCEPGEFRFTIGSSAATSRGQVCLELQGEPALYLQKRIRATGVSIE